MNAQANDAESMLIDRAAYWNEMGHGDEFIGLLYAAAEETESLEEAIAVAEDAAQNEWGEGKGEKSWTRQLGKSFSESDHPRGQPENAGQFTAKEEGEGGSGKMKEKEDPDEEAFRRDMQWGIDEGEINEMLDAENGRDPDKEDYEQLHSDVAKMNQHFREAEKAGKLKEKKTKKKPIRRTSKAKAAIPTKEITEADRDAIRQKIADDLYEDQKNIKPMPKLKDIASRPSDALSETSPAIVAAVSSLDVDRWSEPALKDVYQAVKQTVPSLTIEDFKTEVAKLAEEGRVQLRTYTRSLGQLENPEFAIPAGGEVFLYATKGK